MLFITFLCFVILMNQSLVETNSLENHDICQSLSNKLYFRSEDSGTIEAKNIINNSTDNTIQECNVELITCPSCVITVNITFLKLSYRCERFKYNPYSDCNCEYIQIMEHPYEKISSKKICGSDVVGRLFNYRSQTRNLIIKLVYIYDKSISFIANFKSINNRLILPEKINSNSPTFFTSPYFPSYYLEDLIIEYVISCPKIISDNCQVQLMFTDFQIAPMSIMEFFDWNGERIDIVTGMNFRPPILISNGSSLFIRFYAYGGTGLGYRAEYSFISNQTGHEDYSDYNTDCGGLVENLGGGITMMNMVESGTKKFFCFWIIKPSNYYPSYKTYLYLKIVNLTYMEDTTELIVYKATTTSGEILQVIRPSVFNNKTLISTEHVQPIDTGFYISFKGVFGVKSRLAVVYAAFSYKECFSESNFLCENHRCIARHLTCDGFDHCGDNSDEIAACVEDSNSGPIDRSWYSRRPNYLFPKIDPYSDLKTTSLILILTSFGLISLVSALFILLYKINGRTGHERDIQNHLQIITDILEEEILDTESIHDEPPIYEAPPDYDEIIKIEFDSNIASKKFKRKKKRIQSIKSRKLQGKESANDTEVPEIFSTSNLPPNYNDSCNSENSQLPSTSAMIDVEKIKNKVTGKYCRFYFSDKSLSSNVKHILKRKWHSSGDLNVDKDFELLANVKFNKKRISLFKPLGKLEITKRLHYRKTASDSDLLSLESDDKDFQDSVIFFPTKNYN